MKGVLNRPKFLITGIAAFLIFFSPVSSITPFDFSSYQIEVDELPKNLRRRR
jgi:hypothetical protein